LKIQDIQSKEFYALKILVDKDAIMKWWNYEKSFIDEIDKNDKENKSHCVKIKEDINFEKDGKKYYGFVFELLGSNIYEFTKMNYFMGFNIVQIQQIAKQLLEGIDFIHKIEISRYITLFD
jgi:dual-specificity kinase